MVYDDIIRLERCHAYGDPAAIKHATISCIIRVPAAHVFVENKSFATNTPLMIMRPISDYECLRFTEMSVQRLEIRDLFSLFWLSRVTVRPE